MLLSDNDLNKIDIFSIGLFTKTYSNMYKFCIKNNIKTLEDLIRNRNMLNSLIEQKEFEVGKYIKLLYLKNK